MLPHILSTIEAKLFHSNDLLFLFFPSDFQTLRWNFEGGNVRPFRLELSFMFLLIKKNGKLAGRLSY
jgi:hypothetical protein